MKIFVTDLISGERYEINNLFWFEESNVSSFDNEYFKFEFVSDDVCEWLYKGEHLDYFDTGCGVIHMFLEGYIAENNYKFCPYCGKTIKDVSTYEKT